MDLLLWILIGLAAGSIIATLMPQMNLPSLSGSGWRRIRAMAAGLVGAVAGGMGAVLVDPALRADGLTTALAALAGALWLAAIVEVFSSRRRRGEGGEDRRPAPTSVRATAEMPAYDAARQALVAGLIEDALAHEAGRYAEIGRQLPAIRDRVSRQDPSPNRRLQLAVRFWRRWTTARDERWQSADVEKPIAVADWPRFARTIASDLALDRDTTDSAIVACFADAPAAVA
jgi:uncharacterized membrane protein YeaQ/YmgE (transglycosylase-associated protein family)